MKISPNSYNDAAPEEYPKLPPRMREYTHVGVRVLDYYDREEFYYQIGLFRFKDGLPQHVEGSFGCDLALEEIPTELEYYRVALEQATERIPDIMEWFKEADKQQRLR